MEDLGVTSFGGGRRCCENMTSTKMVVRCMGGGESAIPEGKMEKVGCGVSVKLFNVSNIYHWIESAHLFDSLRVTLYRSQMTRRRI